MTAVFAAGARSRAPELMDDATTDFETFRDCLKDLARVNELTLAYRPTLAFLERLWLAERFPRHRPLEIVDIGSGYGDMIREILRWVEARGVAVALTGLDASRWSARAAAEETPPGAPVVWRTEDVFSSSMTADVVVSSLFVHHLFDEDPARFVAWSERTARLGWFVNDLRRSRFSYEGFRIASRLLGMHRFVRHDGPVSIARGFVEADWRAILAEAEVPYEAAKVRRRFPFRLCVARVKS